MNSEFLNLFNSGNSISVNRPLAHALGVNAAILYGALLGKHLYYLQHDMLKDDGWFYSTIADLQEKHLTYTQTAGAWYRHACKSGAYRNQRKGIACKKVFSYH